MCDTAHTRDDMRGGVGFTQPTMEVGHVPMVEGNLEMWVQLGEESHNTNALLLDTFE